MLVDELLASLLAETGESGAGLQDWDCPPDGTTRPSETTRPRGLTLTVLCTATLMIILDGTLVTVALPSIQRDLHVPTASLTWVLIAYLIAFG